MSDPAIVTCGPRCVRRCVVSGAPQSPSGKLLWCEPPIPREEPPGQTHRTTQRVGTTQIVGHGAVTHGVECYEAWREGENCPHENGSFSKDNNQ